MLSKVVTFRNFNYPLFFKKDNLRRILWQTRGLYARGIQESTPYNELNGEAPSERGTFLRFQVNERVGI